MKLRDILHSKLRLPVFGAPMFIASTPKLVIEQCKAGIIGAIPALNARPQSRLDEWITEIESALQDHQQANPEIPVAPFAINQISHPSNDRLMQDLEVIVAHRVPIVIVSLYVSEEICRQVHSYGGIVLNDVISNHQAKKSVQLGVDGLIAVSAGAGGHTGNVSPYALVAEIREWWNGPLALAGGIANGQMILAALATGADFAYIGSPFLATHEANTSSEYKQMVIRSTARDIITSAAFSGVPANFLVESIRRAGLDPAALRLDPDKPINVSDKGDSHKIWKDIWGCGQGINAVKEVLSTKELVARWEREYAAAKSALIGRISPT